MSSKKGPMTQAMRAMEAEGVDLILHAYIYQHKGGTALASRELGWDEHAIIKTLVFVADGDKPLIILMHGDKEVSTKALARHLGVKTVAPADEATVQRVTGYMVGGISPFGTRTQPPLYLQKTILDLPRILINAGRRGLLAEMDPQLLVGILKAAPVEAAV